MTIKLIKENDPDTQLPRMVVTSDVLHGGVGERFVYEVWELACGVYQVELIELTDLDADAAILGSFKTYDEAKDCVQKHAEEQFAPT